MTIGNCFDVNFLSRSVKFHALTQTELPLDAQNGEQQFCPLAVPVNLNNSETSVFHTFGLLEPISLL